MTLDARYLSGLGVLLVAPHEAEDFFTFKTCRMVPAPLYSVQQGSGEAASFTFELGLDEPLPIQVYFTQMNGFLQDTLPQILFRYNIYFVTEQNLQIH